MDTPSTDAAMVVPVMTTPGQTNCASNAPSWATVLVGLGLGYLADRALHTSPWFLLVGLLLGILGGGYSVVRRLMKEMRRSG